MSDSFEEAKAFLMKDEGGSSLVRLAGWLRD